MKIVFTGGGTGGHFYPLIAVAQKVNKIIDEEKIIGAKLYYFSNDPYDKEALFENSMTYEEVNSGKMRTYFSFRNFTDLFKIFFGILSALKKLFSIYPDVVFSKGGYASFPTVFAARILRIPVIIHESDSSPGRVNKWAGKFADDIAVSFKDAALFFPKNKVAWTGQPVRGEIEHKANKDKSLEYFKLESGLPVILVLGGSQGAEMINNVILDSLPKLTQKYQIIHQTGLNNFKIVKGEADVILGDNPTKARYLPIGFLNPLMMKNAAGASDIIISRAGSTIFEIASWGVPSILIPFTTSVGDHSKKNAFSYARAGACSVVEEVNLKSNIICSEINRIMDDKKLYEQMSHSAKAFYKNDAALKIAKKIIELALGHERK